MNSFMMAAAMRFSIIAFMIFSVTGELYGRNRGPGRALRQLSPTIDDGWHAKPHDYDQILARMTALARHYPESLLRIRNMDRKTAEDRDIAYMRIGGTVHNKKHVVIVGLQHAREWLSASMTMYVAERLLAGYEDDEQSRKYLQNFEVVIVPVLNPDGLQFTMSTRSAGSTSGAAEACAPFESAVGSCDRMWRKNRQHVQDEVCTGIDLNRAWPLDWGSRGGEGVSSVPCQEDYSGQHPFQAVEALALCELLADLHGTSRQQICHLANSSRTDGGWSPSSGLPAQGIVGLLDFHSFGQMILGTWAHLNLQTNNNAIVSGIGTMMQDAANRDCTTLDCMWSYGIGDLDGQLYLTSGTLPDWAHWAFGAASYTIELPPRTQLDGGFSPLETRVQQYTAQSFPIISAFLDGLQKDWSSLITPPSEALTLNCASGNIGELSYDLEVANTLDHYPRELSWEVLDASSRVKLAGWDAEDGGLRPANDFAIGGNMLLCSGVYIVVFRDSNADGTCCGHGHGATTIATRGRILFHGAGSYESMQVLVVKLGSVSVAHVVDHALYPYSEELTQIISRMQNGLDISDLISLEDPSTQNRSSSRSQLMTYVLVSIGALAAAAAAVACVALTYRHIRTKQEQEFRMLRSQASVHRPGTQQSLQASFSSSRRTSQNNPNSTTASCASCQDMAKACPSLAKPVEQCQERGNGTHEILDLNYSSPWMQDTALINRDTNNPLSIADDGPFSQSQQRRSERNRRSIEVLVSPGNSSPGTSSPSRAWQQHMPTHVVQQQHNLFYSSDRNIAEQPSGAARQLSRSMSAISNASLSRIDMNLSGSHRITRMSRSTSNREGEGQADIR